jgi:general secretion pathway protein H
VRACSTAGGFTLIEIMVVVVIIGVISTMLIMSFNLVGTDRNLQNQATRLASLLELSADEAQLQGRDFGLELMRAGYRFVEFDPIVGRWNELFGDDMLRPRALEEELEFELVIEERRVTLEEEAADIAVDDEDEEDDTRDQDLTSDYSPHILILSSGDTTPFELRIVRHFDQAAITLVMPVTGELEIRTANDETY